MSVITNNLSGSSYNNSRIGVTGSVIFANQNAVNFPSFIGSDTSFYVSGTIGNVSLPQRAVFTGDVVVSGSVSVGAITGSNLTVGSMLFVGQTGNITQNNSQLYWDNSSNKLGVGTSNPGDKISVNGSASFTGSVLPGSDLTYNLGSTAKRWNNLYVGTLTSSYLLSETGSITELTSSHLFVTGSESLAGYLQLLPVGTLSIPNNTTASYLYTSGSTNDLYYTQYLPGTDYTNTVRLRWFESALTTGLLHGGVLSTQNGTNTFSITSGSGLIVDFNTSLENEPYPTITVVKWPSYVSQSLYYSGSSQITYVGINSSGGIIQQTTPFDGNDFADRISIGRILHQSGSVTNGATTSPVVAYANTFTNEQFHRSFGPLKISGHYLSNSGSNLSLTKTAGTSYVAGRNYTSNPESPNLVLSSTDTAPTTSKIFREYVSGSTPVIDSGVANAGYATIDPSKYNNNGTLSSVSSGQFSIQRVYWFPNSVSKAFYVYYGSNTYATLDLTEAAINSESFTEGINTLDAAIYLGAICVKGNATDLSSASQARFIQSGLFRAVASTGGGGGGGVATVPGGLDTYVQFNDGGSTFGGDSGLTYNKTTDTLTIGNISIGDTGLLSTTGTSVSVFNSNATTVNFAGGASTALNVGNSSGINTISGNTKFNQKIDIGDVSTILSGSVTTSSTSPQTLLAIDSLSYRSAEFVVQSVDSSGSKYMTAKILAIHNGTTTTYTEYGQINSGGITGTLSVSDPTIPANNILLQVTPASSNSTVWKVTAILTKS